MAFEPKKRKASMATQEAIAMVEATLKAASCDPIKELAEIAMSTSTPRDEKVSILKELAQYIAPKRKAIDVTTSGDMSVTVYIKKFSKDPDQILGMLTPEAGGLKPQDEYQGKPPVTSDPGPSDGD